MNKNFQLVMGLLALVLSGSAFADETRRHEATAAEVAAAIARNQLANEQLKDRAAPPYKPVPEIAPYKYVVFSGSFGFSSHVAKETMARNLPEGVKLVVMTDAMNVSSTREQFEQWIASDRLIVAAVSSPSYAFWSRDSFPFPVETTASGRAGLVAAKYDRPFYGQRDVAAAVGQALYAEHDFTIVGGNLQADEFGNCLVVDSPRLYGLKPATLQAAYGCKKVTLLRYVAGIGDVDEVVKILPNKRVLTNQESYRSTLEGLGYQVTMLPVAGGYRTHANSIIVGNTVFMPAYQQPSDAEARIVYESFGYRVVPVDSRNLSDNGRGSLHCITMMYPDFSEDRLLDLLGAVAF